MSNLTSFGDQLREEREAKQNALFTPWQRLSSWGKAKFFGQILIRYILVFFIPTAISYKYLIFGGLIAKIIAIPFATFFTYAIFFFIDSDRNILRKLKGKDRIEFKDDLNDLPYRSLVKKS